MLMLLWDPAKIHVPRCHVTQNEQDLLAYIYIDHNKQQDILYEFVLLVIIRVNPIHFISYFLVLFLIRN